MAVTNRKGFSLTEIVIVVVLIAIITTVVGIEAVLLNNSSK